MRHVLSRHEMKIGTDFAGREENQRVKGKYENRSVLAKLLDGKRIKELVFMAAVHS